MSRSTVLSNGLRALVLLSVALLAAPMDASAQSLFANRGLGLVVEPVDARTAALGGVTLGLPRGEITWANPADLAGLPAPGLRAAFQMDDFTSDVSGRELDGSTARFPLIMGAFPAGDRWVLSAGYGAFLDQNWAIEHQDTLVLGADTAYVLDRLVSEGGVARLRLGAAYSVSQPLSLGLAVDVFTGVSQRQFGRSFAGENPACCRIDWQYSGLGATLGTSWSPSEALSVSAAASFGGRLEAKSDSAGIESSTFSIPTMLRAGVSARVAANTLVAASAQWGGWSALDDELASVGGAQDSWSIGGGVEWEGVTFRTRPVPLRLGGRYASLPFSWSQPGNDLDFPTERALSTGVGILLASGAARTDISFEMGSRGGTGAGLSENFSRIIFSVTALGR